MNSKYKTHYPIDMLGISKIGVEKWLDNYEPPFNPIEYKRWHLKIFNSYLSTFCKNDNWKMQMFFLANFKIVFYVSEAIKAKSIKNKICNEYDYIISDTSYKTNEYDWYQFSDSLKLKTIAIPNVSLQNKIRIQLKNIYLNFKYIKNLSSKNIIYYQGTYSNEIKALLLTKQYFPQNLLLKKSYFKNRLFQLPKETRLMVSEFVGLYDILDNEEKKIVINSILSMLDNNWIVYNQLLENINSKHKILLSNGLGSIMHRLIIAAWRINGGKVIGFIHGNTDYTANRIDYLGYDGLLICDEFYCTTRNQIKQLNEIIKKHASSFDAAKLLINE